MPQEAAGGTRRETAERLQSDRQGLYTQPRNWILNVLPLVALAASRRRDSNAASSLNLAGGGIEVQSRSRMVPSASGFPWPWAMGP